MSPRSLRQFLEVFRKTSINYMMYIEKFGEQDQQAPIEEVKEFGQFGTHSLPDRRPTSSPRCTSTSLWKALQTLISKMESHKSC